MFRTVSPPPRASRFTLWSRRTTTLLAPSSGLRTEVCPPSLRCPPTGGAWQRLMFWLMAPAGRNTAPPMNRLPGVRQEFLATLADIDGVDAEQLRLRIENTRSLRELWHLRAEAYRVVGLAHSESQATERLALLNRHFPTRAPRSQFAAL